MDSRGGNPMFQYGHRFLLSECYVVYSFQGVSEGGSKNSKKVSVLALSY